MKKLPGQGGITKKIAIKIGKANRNKFAEKVAVDLSNLMAELNQKKSIAMEIVSFSSFNDYDEQIFSMISFVRYVGIPLKWTLYSDGSHTQDQIDHLENNFNFLKVVKGLNWSELQSLKGLCKEEIEPYEEYLIHFAQNSPYGKKLFYYLNHSIENPTLLIDSDILFYKKATILELILTEEPKANGWFLPDFIWGCLDSRYQAVFTEQVYQVNSGFIFANVAFEHLQASLEFFKTYNFTYENFTEQTFYHQLLRDNSYMALPTKTFILDSGDQFDFSYSYHPKEMAIRHYTGPVRHKMWQKDYKWHLDL